MENDSSMQHTVANAAQNLRFHLDPANRVAAAYLAFVTVAIGLFCLHGSVGWLCLSGACLLGILNPLGCLFSIPFWEADGAEAAMAWFSGLVLSVIWLWLVGGLWSVPRRCPKVVRPRPRKRWPFLALGCALFMAGICLHGTLRVAAKQFDTVSQPDFAKMAASSTLGDVCRNQYPVLSYYLRSAHVNMDRYHRQLGASGFLGERFRHFFRICTALVAVLCAVGIWCLLTTTQKTGVAVRAGEMTLVMLILGRLWACVHLLL